MWFRDYTSPRCPYLPCFPEAFTFCTLCPYMLSPVDWSIRFFRVVSIHHISLVANSQPPEIRLLSYQHFACGGKIACGQRIEVNTTRHRLTQRISAVPIRRTTASPAGGCPNATFRINLPSAWTSKLLWSPHSLAMR